MVRPSDALVRPNPTPASTSTVTIPDQGGELGDTNIPNLISASTPFTYIVK